MSKGMPLHSPSRCVFPLFLIPSLHHPNRQILAILLSAFLMFYNHSENKRRDHLYGVPALDGSDCSPEKASDPDLLRTWQMEEKSEDEVISLGDLHPAFR
jgi:hypothetical protein